MDSYGLIKTGLQKKKSAEKNEKLGFRYLQAPPKY